VQGSCRTRRSRCRTSSTGRDALLRQGDRHGHRHRPRAHDLRRVGRADPAARRGARPTSASAPTVGSATFAWNTARHLELYFAAPCTGRVLHTLNIRLFPEQLTYIVNHAEDEVVFVDRSLVALLWPLLDTFETVRHVVVMDDGGARSPTPTAARFELHDYEELLARLGPRRVLRRGRTSRRVDVLHERHHRQPQGRGVLAPLHVPAHARRDGGRRHRRWREDRPDPAGGPDVPRQRVGSGPRRGGRGRHPGHARPRPDAHRPWPSLIESERVTVAAGVPDHLDGRAARARRAATRRLRAIPCGGSAVPRALSEAYREQTGLPILQAWGMTETSPIASVGRIKSTSTAVLDDDGWPTCAPRVG
jgi:fatty-acyl-CoA synthase